MSAARERALLRSNYPLAGSIGGDANAVKAKALLSHSTGGRCGLVAPCGLRFDVGLALRQNVIERYSGDLQQGMRCARHKLKNLFVGMGES